MTVEKQAKANEMSLEKAVKLVVEGVKASHQITEAAFTERLIKPYKLEGKAVDQLVQEFEDNGISIVDEDGKPLPCVNEQTTYLHIVRLGAQPPADEQDKRPWVVKVVKRAATVSFFSCLHGIWQRLVIFFPDWSSYFPTTRDLWSVKLYFYFW